MPAMTRIHYLAGLAWVAVCAVLVVGAPASGAHATAPHPAPVAAGTGQQWFAQVKARCNTVEVELTWRNNPPPATLDGQGFGAACLALGGRLDSARAVIDRLAPSDRARAAGIVFEVAHPIADAGDDRSAGPIMNMVVDYWPTHYMALYHAGMADYALGHRASARGLLERFLVEYHESDGWRSNAERVLQELKR
jgi:hypothetical protein